MRDDNEAFFYKLSEKWLAGRPQKRWLEFSDRNKWYIRLNLKEKQKKTKIIENVFQVSPNLR